MIIQWILLNKIQGFIKWKKLYYETKHDPEKIPSEIKFSHDSSLLDIARCVLNIGVLEMSSLHISQTCEQGVLQPDSQHLSKTTT